MNIKKEENLKKYNEQTHTYRPFKFKAKNNKREHKNESNELGNKLLFQRAPFKFIKIIRLIN